MKVVLDTNVVMSAIFWKGTPRKIFDEWIKGRFQLVITPNILSEYQRVGEELAKKYKGLDFLEVMEFITLNSFMVPDFDMARAISKDKDDDKFIACAISTNAKFVVSGDKHLLEIVEAFPFKILTASAFLHQLN